jgi:hypothetical protein
MVYTGKMKKRSGSMKKISILPLWGLSRFFLPALVFCVLLAACPNPSGGSEGVYSAVPPDSAKGITAFTFTSPPVTGTIDDTAKTVVALVPPGTALTNLVPDITVSADARVSPGSGEARDFSAPVTYTVTGVDASIQIWTVTVQWGPFNNIVDMWNYLSESSANPVPLPVSINLADLSGNGWTDLLSAINAEGKNVALDLSACTMDVSSSGVMEFDLGTDAVGKDKIVSLVLPDEAESIKAGTYGRPIFQNFTALTELSGKNVKTIGDNVFSGCTTLTEVDFPAATDIGNYAFRGCTSLNTVNLSEATSIGIYAFKGCISLETLTLPEATTIGQRAFYDCTSLKIVNFPAVTTIDQCAFEGCIKLTKLTIVNLPMAITIGQRAFEGCTSLETVDLPAVETIGQYAFQSCTSLKTVTFPKATSIGERAFYYGCTKLETVNLPAAETIGSFAFDGCINLTTLKLPALPPTLGSSVFNNTNNTGTLSIVVPQNSVSAYTTDWGVADVVAANGASAKYGYNHKAITITDTPSP